MGPRIDRARRQSAPQTVRRALDLLTRRTPRCLPADLLGRSPTHESETGGSEGHTFLASTLPDVDVRAFTPRVVGPTLVDKIIEHVLPILTGASRDGRGALVHTMAARTVGSYAFEASQTCSWPMNEQHPRASSTRVASGLLRARRPTTAGLDWPRPNP